LPNKNFLSAFLFSLFVLLVSLWPKEQLPPGPEGSDKLVHLVLYFILYYLWAKVVHTYGSLLTALVVFGTGIEFLQEWLPVNRTFDIWDVVFNVLGLGLGYGYIKFREKVPGSDKNA